MSKIAIRVSYAQSLLWLALFMTVTSGVTYVVELFFIDFVHGNPHRTQASVLAMMIDPESWLILVFVAVIGTLLVFTLPQLFQAVLISALGPMFSDRARFAPLLALPLTAALTWYCYDYLTPSNLCFAGSCMEEYEHGITLSRYLKSFAVQAPITLFSFLYPDAGLRGVSRKQVLFGALAFAVVAGGVRGYVTAQQQIAFLSSGR